MATNRGIQIPNAMLSRLYIYIYIVEAPNMFVSSEWNVMLPFLRQEFWSGC